MNAMDAEQWSHTGGEAVPHQAVERQAGTTPRRAGQSTEDTVMARIEGEGGSCRHLASRPYSGLERDPTGEDLVDGRGSGCRGMQTEAAGDGTSTICGTEPFHLPPLSGRESPLKSGERTDNREHRGSSREEAQPRFLLGSDLPSIQEQSAAGSAHASLETAGVVSRSFPLGGLLPPAASAALHSGLSEAGKEMFERKTTLLKELLDEKTTLLTQARVELGHARGRQNDELRQILHLREELKQRKEEQLEVEARLLELSRENEQLSAKLAAARKAALCREEDFNRLQGRSDEEFRHSAETRFQLQSECELLRTELDRLRADYENLKECGEQAAKREAARVEEVFRLELLLRSARADLKMKTVRLSEVDDQLRTSRQYICYLERLIRGLRFFVKYEIQSESPPEATEDPCRIHAEPSASLREHEEARLPMDAGRNGGASGATELKDRVDTVDSRKRALAEGSSNYEGEHRSSPFACIVAVENPTSSAVSSALFARTLARSCGMQRGGTAYLQSDGREGGKAAESASSRPVDRMNSAARGGHASAAMTNISELARRGFELEHLELRLDAERRTVDAALRDTVEEIPRLEGEDLFQRSIGFLPFKQTQEASASQSCEQEGQRDLEPANDYVPRTCFEGVSGECLDFLDSRMERAWGRGGGARSSPVSNAHAWRDTCTRCADANVPNFRSKEESRPWVEGDDEEMEGRGANGDPAMAYLEHLVRRAHEDIRGGEPRTIRGRVPVRLADRSRVQGMPGDSFSPRDSECRTPGSLVPIRPCRCSSLVSLPNVPASSVSRSPATLGSLARRLPRPGDGRTSKPGFGGRQRSPFDAFPCVLSPALGPAPDGTVPVSPTVDCFLKDRRSKTPPSSWKFRGIGVPPHRAQAQASSKARFAPFPPPDRFLSSKLLPGTVTQRCQKQYSNGTLEGENYSDNSLDDLDLISINDDALRRPPPLSGSPQLSFLHCESSRSPLRSSLHGNMPQLFDTLRLAHSGGDSPRSCTPAQQGRCRGTLPRCSSRGDRALKGRFVRPSLPPPVVIAHGTEVLSAEGAAVRLAREIRDHSPARKSKEVLRTARVSGGTRLRPRWKAG
ncbi:hypothetical protein BESB_037310 [Besnoitia besnoiti]|uniref:Uncharacterized protein n=1 Tax=Besnoitia besnoiti TaxID=94643 RepID=A0A2A9MN49_BESBE|nr:hypothetical protein BESB_037310 [Besnoitia besnoiti]PFH37273.1 hypothetical protein BESB_037310 [Besnoitia besnoiti]